MDTKVVGMRQGKDAANELSHEIARVVKGLIDAKHMNASKLSKAIGYSQSRMSDLLSGKPNCQWTTHLLCMIASYFGIPIYEIIKAAETKEEISLSKLRFCSTQPCSMERLNLIVQSVAPAGEDESLMNLYYTAQMFQIVAPKYVREYIDGRISDDEVLSILKDIINCMSNGSNLWVEVKEKLGKN